MVNNPRRQEHVFTSANDHVVADGQSVQSLKAVINAVVNGTNLIVAGTPGKIIRVVQYVFTVAADATITWESGGGTVIAGPMDFGAKGGAAPPFSPIGHFETLPGEDLLLVTAVQIGGHLGYVLI